MKKFLLILSLIVCTTTVACLWRQVQNKANETSIEKVQNILVLGSDALLPKNLKDWYGRSDLLLLININHSKKAISLLSIPRDTRINLANYPQVRRINTANAYAGYELSRKAVEKLLDIKVDNTLVFSMASVVELLNSLGEFKIYVPKDMNYDDNTANLHIHIQAGLQTMKGKMLLKFLRYRNDALGDIGRIERQHIFFRAAFKKFTEPKTLLSLPDFLVKVNKAFLSDMSFKEMFTLLTLLKDFKSEKFNSYIVPGNFSSKGSWVVNKQQLSEIMDKIYYREPKSL